MPAQTTRARTRTRRAPEASGPLLYYGFDPAQAYTLRSRVRAYNGTTEKFVFANGQAVAMPMRPDASEEQRWARGERLGRLSSDRTYRIYPYGEEPAAHREPMWEGQADPMAIAGDEDTGESTHVWQPVSTGKPPVQMPVEGPTPAGRTSNELREALPKKDRDTGEMKPAAVDPLAKPAAPPAWDRAPGGETT